jgi:hypothetical protein
MSPGCLPKNRTGQVVMRDGIPVARQAGASRAVIYTSSAQNREPSKGKQEATKK